MKACSADDRPCAQSGLTESTARQRNQLVWAARALTAPPGSPGGVPGPASLLLMAAAPLALGALLLLSPGPPTPNRHACSRPCGPKPGGAPRPSSAAGLPAGCAGPRCSTLNPPGKVAAPALLLLKGDVACSWATGEPGSRQSCPSAPDGSPLPPRLALATGELESCCLALGTGGGPRLPSQRSKSGSGATLARDTPL